MPKRRWNLDRGTWPAIEQIVHLSQQRTQLDDFLRRPTDHRGRGWIPSGYRTGNTSSYLLGYSSCFFHSIDPILYAISTIPLYYVGHSESCWLRGPSRSVSITNLPFSLLFYYYFFVYKKKNRFLVASISVNSLLRDRFDVAAVVAIGPEWNQPVSVSAKKTIMPVRNYSYTHKFHNLSFNKFHFSLSFEKSRSHRRFYFGTN